MRIHNFINNQWCDAQSKAMLNIENPFTEEVIAAVPASQAVDIEYAVQSAHAAFNDWRMLTVDERSAYMRDMATKSRLHADSIAKLITAEVGKPLSEALGEVESVASYLEYYAELARDHKGRLLAPVDEKSMSLVSYEPYGVVGCILPWNYPMTLMGWKLSPILAAGNTIVIKPSELTPLSLLHWIEVAACDLPPGVINVVTGSGIEAGEALVKHPHVPVITFTGSITTGKRISRMASEHLKKLSLELGGKDPVIVCDDANIDVAAKGVAWGGFLNAGQVCTSLERVYVFDSIADQFIEALLEESKKLVLGDPMDNATQIGPMVSKVQWSKTVEKVGLAQQQGARLLLGGARPSYLERGHFYAPTVFDQVSSDMDIMTEETFSPILPVQRVGSFSEAIKCANQTRYGLGACIFTRDMQRALIAGNEIKSGTVCINSPLMENIAAPFGGMKQSGAGREHGIEGLTEFQQAKHIFIDYQHVEKEWWYSNS